MPEIWCTAPASRKEPDQVRTHRCKTGDDDVVEHPADDISELATPKASKKSYMQDSKSRRV